MTRTLQIDWTRCDGHGLCAELLPDRIALDDWGSPIIRPADGSETDDTQLRRTVAACPALALRLATAPRGNLR
jgi:ferredoxin